jgi:2-polyprenyl-6-hydroxyphenyl methylase/3-demethylubiquinone-9 3-methyltransferase
MGALEIPMAELYRSCFISLNHLGAQLAGMSTPHRILEVGCGDGALAQRLTKVFPDVEYVGIDVADTAGRLYRGDPARATFRHMSSSELRAEAPEPFDLTIIADVLHHIPLGIRGQVLDDVAALTADDGHIVVKEWESDRPFFGRMAYWADRYITGDKDVEFMTNRQLKELLADNLKGFRITHESRVRPWKENVLLILGRSAATGPGVA